MPPQNQSGARGSRLPISLHIGPSARRPVLQQVSIYGGPTMNALTYLVMARCIRDDVVVSLHADRAEAFDAAEKVGVAKEISEELARVFLGSAGDEEIRREVVYPIVVTYRNGKPVEVIELTKFLFPPYREWEQKLKAAMTER